MRLNEMNNLHLDGIKEAANIGSGHAASALSQMIGKNIMVNVPEVKIMKLEDVPYIFGDEPPIVSAILTNFFGDFTGRNLLVFSEEKARLLLDILFGKPFGTTTEFGEMEISTIKEIANIVSSSYLSAISEFLGIMVLPSVPAFVLDNLASVLTTVYTDFTQDKELAICVETSFYFAEQEIELEGIMLMIPDPIGLDRILKAMGLI